MEIKDEKQVARISEHMLAIAMGRKISSLGFKEHAQGSKQSISTATGRADTKVGKGPNGTLKMYMNRLSLVMPRHGFVQHYGVAGIREGGQRTRHKPRSTTYNFASHYFKLPEKNYIGKAVQESGLVDFVLENISRIRCKDVFVGLKNFIEK